jgi:PAS domain S-box-containing protein
MTARQPDNDRQASPPDSVIDLTRLVALLDHAHDAVFVRNLDGEILYWNKGAERAYGWTSDEAGGEIAHALLKTGFPKPLVVIEQALREHGEWEGRLAHTDRHGRTTIVESRWALDVAGGVGTVLEINRDITPRLEAQEAARAREWQLRFITDNAPVAIAHCDTDNRFKFVNKPYATRFGLHPSQLIGRTIADVLGEGAFETIKPYVTRVLGGEHVEVEIEIPYEKLGPQFMRFAYEPELDDAGRVVGYVAATLDGGTVTAHSDGVDRGSRFVVRLPRAVRETREVKDEPATRAPEGVVRKRVLVVDDNVDAAESLQLWLEMAGHEVQIAADGPRALVAAESLRPEVVLLDLGMPGMNGFEVARRIRAAPWGRKMVLVALTGWGQEEDRRQTREAGFDHHLTKPVPPDEIEELIRRV